MERKYRLAWLALLALSICFANFTGVLCAADTPTGNQPAGTGETSAVKPPGSDEAQKILTKANETMAGFKSMKGVIVDTSERGQTNSRTIIYQRKNSDGSMESRVETESYVRRKRYANLSITNREGSWRLTPTTAIKMEYQEALQMAAQQTMAGADKAAMVPANISLSETTLNGESYWIVKEETSEAARQKVRQMLESNPGMKDAFKSIPVDSMPIPKLTLYRIGKKDNILYSTQQYDDKGNKLSDVTYESVQINLPLADDIFKIPKNLKIKVAKTLTDYTTLINKK